MKKIFRRRAWLVAGLLWVAILVSGCGGNGEHQAQSDGNSKGGTKGKGSGALTADLPTVMGRYVEQEIPHAEDNGVYGAALVPMENGLYLVHGYGTDAKVELEGKSFSGEEGELPIIVSVPSDEMPAPLRSHIKKDDYITQIVMAENKARMYTIFAPDAQDSQKYHYEKYFLDPEGREQVWDADGAVGRDENVFYSVGDDGFFYVLTTKGTQRVYRVDQISGKAEYLMDFTGVGAEVCSIKVFGGRLFAETFGGICIFELNAPEEMKTDKELNALLEGKLGQSAAEYGSSYLLYPAEGDSIYIATTKGLYRHVLYGNVSELMIDGSLCSLGDVSKYFADMYVDEEGENGMPVFYFLYEDGKLSRFAYDPNIPATPEKVITLYSLCENRDIRLVISAYQLKHKDSYIRYEVGMSGQDGTTREDALQTLATRIAAGEGPDIFVMDDLPYRSYVEKGVLADLGALYGELAAERNYFDNVVGAFYEGEKLCALPMMFSVPLLIGKEETLQNITDEESLIRAVEGARVSDKAFRAGLMTADHVLMCLSYADAPCWLTVDGRLDREALTEFLNRCRRLYTADRADITERNLMARMGQDAGLWTAPDSRWKYRQSYTVESVLMDQMVYGEAFAIGMQGGDVSSRLNMYFANLQAAGLGYRLLPGRGRVCLPCNILGINAATGVKEDAMDFVKYALSDYLAETEDISAIPVNRDALIAMEQNPYDSYEPYIYLMTSIALDVDGDSGGFETGPVEIDVAWQRPEVYEAYNAMLDSIDMVNLCEMELLNAVMEQGRAAVTGEKTVEEAVDAIAKKVQIYLAE